VRRRQRVRRSPEEKAALPRRLVRFGALTFARSFEYAGGRFYVGLGADKESMNESCGDIYEITPPPVVRE